MKKIVSIMMSLFIASSAFAQYCGTSPNGLTPQLNSNPGLYPSFEIVPCFYQGVDVEDTIYFTNYTSFGGQNVDSLTIDSIGDLPDGLCWNTNKATNTFLGGENGVIYIHGTSYSPGGQYRLGIYITGVAGPITLPPYTNASTLLGLYYYLRLACSNSGCPAYDTINGKTTPFIAYTPCSGTPPPGFTVTINPNQTSTICVGSSIALVAYASTGGPVQYHWSTGEVTDSIVVSPSVGTNYAVTAVDDSGAIAYGNFFVNVNTPPTALFTLQADTTPHVWDIQNQCNGASLTYLWTWGDGTSTATTDPGLSHTYDTAGYYTVCVYLTAYDGCTASYCDSSVYMFKDQSGQMIQLNVIPQTPTGISSVTMPEQQISYYGGEVHFSEMVTAPADVRLYDLSGREVMRKNSFTGNTLPLNGAISQGVYIISLQNNTYSLSRKLAILQ